MKNLIEGDPPQPGTADFSRTKVLPDIFHLSNFEYSAFSGLKVDSSVRKKNQEKRKSKKNNIQDGVNEHNRKKGG